MAAPPGPILSALQDPFAQDLERLRADVTAHAPEPAAALRALLDRGEGEAAEDLVLALGHLAALEASRDPARVLAERTVPQRLWKKLPRNRNAILRVVMAAGRCHEVLCGLRGSSDAMSRLRSEVWAACFGQSLRHALELESVIHDHDVLLLGETGTGKEVVARALLEAQPGGRDAGLAPSAALNAAEVPATLIESELFGHVKGAFTGAVADREGLLRSAHGGCFFIDEVGDLPLNAQVKLLRVMETNAVNPIGSDRDEVVNVRYIAATQKPLAEMVARGEFRHDLFQRLAGRVIHLPPLRERPEDVLDIGLAFVEDHVGDGGAVAEHRARAREWLDSRAVRGHDWSGNVRELQNLLRSLMLGLEPVLRKDMGLPAAGSGEQLPPRLREHAASLREVEDWYLKRVLAHTHHNYAETARILGVDRSTARRRAREVED